MTFTYCKNILVTTILFLYIAPFTSGQTISVVSSEDRQPIPGAKVEISLKNKTYNYHTNLYGELTLEKSFNNQPLSLLISYETYIDLKLESTSITRDTTIALSLSFNDVEEVIVTAQYKAKHIEKAVHHIKVIDRQKIESMAAQDLKDVFTNELNVRIGEDNILGSSMQLQGIGGENVKILVDGVPLTGRLNGNIDLSQIPLENVDRIEVVEGPLSVNYGTDALAGTINIITTKKQSNQINFNSVNYFESSGKFNNTASLGWQFKKHQVRLEGGRYFFNGWDPSHRVFHYNPNPIADSTRVMQWNPKEQYFGGINYHFNGENALFNYSGQVFNENIINRGMPRPPYKQIAFDDYYKTMRINQRAYYQYNFKTNYRLSFTLAYNGYLRWKNTKVRDLTEITDILSENPSDHDTSQYHSFIARGSFIQSKSNKKINYELGYDVLYEMAQGERIFEKKQSIGDYALFATAEYTPIKSFIVRPGIRYSYNSKYASPLIPSINLKYTLLKRSNQSLNLRTSYARGFRSPSIKELHYEFVDINHNILGNPDLKAETANHFNLSIHQKLRVKNLIIKNKIVGFYNDIHQLITLSQASETEYTYFNLKRYKTTGIQIESNLKQNNLTLGLGIGYVGRYNELSDKNNMHFLFSPEAKFNLQFNWVKLGIQTALFYKYTGTLPSIRTNEDGELYQSNISDYHMADIAISKSIWDKRIKVTIGVKNLFDVTSITGSTSGDGAHSVSSSSLSVGIGRVYHLGLKLNLNTK